MSNEHQSVDKIVLPLGDQWCGGIREEYLLRLVGLNCPEHVWNLNAICVRTRK
jgi:hypothetical protein